MKKYVVEFTVIDKCLWGPSESVEIMAASRYEAVARFYLAHGDDDAEVEVVDCYEYGGFSPEDDFTL